MTFISQLDEALQAAVDQALVQAFDRELFAANLASAFALVRKRPPLPDLVMTREAQLAKLAARTAVIVEGGQLKVVPDSADHAVFQSMTFGCDWHDSIDMDSVVKASLRGE